MSYTGAVPVPQGLPGHLSIGEEGYEALCSLLDIATTQQKKDIVNVEAVKKCLSKKPDVPRRGRQAERLRASLLALYGDPDARRDIWHYHFDLLPGRESARDYYAVPSLERAALRAYEEDLLTAQPEPGSLADCEAFFSPDIAGDDWRAPALAALPRLKTELESWSSVAAERKSHVVLAAFGVATLLEDARLLHWAAASDPDLAREFGFLDVAVAHHGVATSAADLSADQAQVDTLAQLRDRTTALASAASDLVDRPATDALFDAVAARSEDLLELRVPILALVADTNALSDLHAELTGLLKDKAEAAPWFAGELEQVLAKWQEIYPATKGTRAEVLRVDVDRVVRVIDPAFAEVAAAEASALTAREELQAAIGATAAPSVADIRRQAALSQDVAQSAQQVVRATDEALSVLEPDPTTGGSEGSDAAEEAPSSEASEPPGAEPAPDTVPTRTSTDAVSRPVPPPDGMAGSAEDLSQAGEAEAPGERPTADVPEDRPTPAQPGSGAPSTSTPEMRTLRATALEARAPTPPVDQPVRTDDEVTPSDMGPQGATSGDAVPQAAPAIPEAPDGDQEAIWRAVGRGCLGLAYHVAKLVRATGGSAVHPTPELLEALALGMALRGPEDELSIAFAQQVGPLSGLNFAACDAPLRDALNLLLLTVSLRPALFSSQQGASIRLLRRVEFSGKLSPVRSLAYAVAASAEKLQGGRLDVATLTAILGEGLWSDRLVDTRERVERWREGAVSASFIGPARAVWQHWLSSGGPLGELRRLLTVGTAGDAPRVREVVAVLGDPKAVRDLVEDTHRDLGRHGASIVGNALEQLQRHLNDPRDLAERWLRIIDAGPGGGRVLDGEVERLRDRVNSLAPPALEAVTRLRETDPAIPLASALVRAEAAIESLASFFQGGGDLDWPLGPETVRQALRDDLLFVTAIPVDEAGHIDSSLASADALALLTDTAAHAVDLRDAFERRLGQGDLQGAHAVCERMETEDHAAAEDARVRMRHAVGERRASLEGRVFELVGWLEQAFIARKLEEDERAEMTAAIDEVSRCLEKEAGVLAADKTVDAVAATIEPAIARAVVDVKSQLSEFLPLDDAREQALVESALGARDVATLREQLGWLRADQPIRSPDSDDCTRLPAFLDAADRVEAESVSQTGPVPHEVLRAVRSRQDVLGLAFSDLAPGQSERSATLLEYWFEMVRARSADQETLAGFFTALGFNLRSPGVEVRGDAKAVLRVEPLRVPAVCPDHTFGSDAEGRYDVLLNSSPTARESIIQAVTAADSRGHTVVLHLGKLTRNDREGLRRWSIDEAVPFITIDENLVLYLASVSEGTLRPLFDCTLPFTCTRPYFTAAGLVPPEAFFGREGERGKIRDRYGSCFVYGGRQLGKTALLHDVRAAFHSPEQGHLAEYIDLKARDVGIAEDPEHLWHVLWGTLKHLGVVDDGAPMPRGRKRLVENVEEEVERWLGESQGRRLLVLLDEADAFLEADLKDDNPFRVSTRLKGLMDRTERRFKAVLCGLHNVLRNTERANHPLAHFGDPVCVGPLLENGDLRRARELVRNPMAAVGYTFQSENLITKILLWTNYYPSLIQVFCEALLDHLRQVPGRRFLDPITDEEVRRVFGRPELRDRIRGLFSLTLGLDQRYEVVAYAMAYELLHSEHNSADGLPRRLIFDRVREYWKAGFDIREREFETLLLEMCGLGVLRQRPDAAGVAHFAFRNLNVLHLLGDDDTMVEVLSKEREAPVLFDAPTWHARYPGAKLESRRRGPLTYQQESDLNKGGRVAVVCGTAAANVDDVVDFLASRMEDRVLTLKSTTDGNALATQVKSLRPDRPDRATVLRVVNDEKLWTLRWIEGVAEALHTAERGRSTRVVFRADPEKLWDFVEHLPAECLDASPDGLFDWVVVGPWDEVFVKQWCSDHALHEANSKTRELFQLTGGWPWLLEGYADCSETTWQARADALDRYIMGCRDEVLARLGLGASDTRRALAPLLAWSPSPLRADEVDTYAELWAEAGPPVEPEVLRRRLFWAMQLGLIENDNGSGSFNPLVARLLSDNGE